MIRPRYLVISSMLLGLLGLRARPAQAAQELGLNVHQSVDLGLDITRDAGLGWVRIDLNWFNAQPNPGPSDFTLFDTLVNEALARNLQVLAVVGYGPVWASSGDGLGDGSHNDVPVAGAYEQFVAEALRSKTTVRMNATCAVFAQSEVVGLLARNVPLSDIAAAAHNAIASRIASMTHRVGGRGAYWFVGGGARNGALVTAVEEMLHKKVHVPADAQLVVAIGAAVGARKRAAKSAERERR